MASCTLCGMWFGCVENLMWCSLIAVRVLGCSMLVVVFAAFGCWVWLNGLLLSFLDSGELVDSCVYSC